jgi:Collagen triple helix repeat (20 copies)
MLSPRNNRFGIPGVISVIALVFAMLGGAYAASDDSGSGSKATASAKAKKGPRGPRGKAGPAGPAGPVGPAGAKGDTGAAGSNGINGKDGTAGASVTNTPVATNVAGECNKLGGAKFTVGAGAPTFACNGKEGEKGDPWTAGGFLPSGETLTGTWAAGGEAAGTQYVPISFPLPLEEAPDLTIVWLSFGPGAEPFEPSEINEILEEGAERGCPGFDEGLPLADPGHLCVYADFLAQLKPAGTGLPVTKRPPGEFTVPQIYTGGSLIPKPNGGGKTSGVGRVGTTLEMTCELAGCNGLGVWAVTAE